MCVDVHGYRNVNVYKHPPTRLQASALPVFPYPVLYAGDFNCPHVNWSYRITHVNWGYRTNSADGECLVAWASLNGLVPPHDSKDVAIFHSGCWNTDTNPDLTFVSFGPDSRVPDKCILRSSLGHNIDPRLLFHQDLLCLFRTSLLSDGTFARQTGATTMQQTRQEFVATRFTECGSDLPGLLQCHQNSSQKFYPMRLLSK